MSGVEFVAIGPAIAITMKLVHKAGLEFAGYHVQAHAMDMIASGVADDIHDAKLFLAKLTEHPNYDLQLRNRVNHSIWMAQYAVDKFTEHLADYKDHQTLSLLLGDHAKVRRFMAPLQASQAQLARRIDWVRAALSELDKNVNPEDDKPQLASSVPPSERPGWVDKKD